MGTEPPDRDAGPSDRATALWLVAILVVAAAVRAHELGTGLWFDEILTLVNDASKPVGRIVTTYESQNTHPLYSVLAASSVSAFGESAWALRLPAAVFGVAGVAAVYGLGALVASRREALLAAALLAVSYHHVWFSQNARGYTALMFWAVIGTALFVELLRGGAVDRSRVALYAVSMALAAWTHLTGVVVIAAHGTVWAGAAWADRRATDRSPGWAPAIGVAAATATTALLYAPILPEVIDSVLRPDPATQAIRAGTRWTNPLWMAVETVRGLARGTPGGLVALVAGAVVGVAGLVDYGRRDPAVAALLTLPAVGVAGVVLTTGHNLWPRFFFFAAGFAVLIAVRGVFAITGRVVPRRAPAVATVVVALGVLAFAARLPAAWGPKQDYEGARAFVEARRGPGDAVVTLAMATLPYAAEAPAGWTGLTEDDPAALEAIERSHERTWAIWAFPTWVEASQPGVWRRVRSEYRRVAEFPGTVREGSVVVAVRG